MSIIEKLIIEKNLIKINNTFILFKTKKVENSKDIKSPNKGFILSTEKKIEFFFIYNWLK